MPVFLLGDCNDFYVQAERAFDPCLINKPVIVLSNNDGCAVSRSKEAKALGIKMGVPLFKIRDLVRQHDVQVLSSNYALYADMSNRVMSIMARFSPVQEIYSIDECFLEMTGFSNVTTLAGQMRAQIKLETGLPVCVGIGPTKTLAKLSNYVAKRHPKSKGVFNLNDLTPRQANSVFENIAIEEVWGIGRRLNASLTAAGVNTVAELRAADIASMRKKYGVIMEKLIRELRGESCIDIQEVAPAKQQIINSRSFGQPVAAIEDLQDALAHFVSNAAVKLRKQNSLAGMLQVFIMTDRFREERPQYNPCISIPLTTPTANTSELQGWAVKGLQEIYREGYLYKKAGVILTGIVPGDFYQGDMFAGTPSSPALMEVMDNINARYGKGTLKLSQDGSRMAWAMRQERKSPAYTTDWQQLPVCR